MCTDCINANELEKIQKRVSKLKLLGKLGRVFYDRFSFFGTENDCIFTDLFIGKQYKEKVFNTDDNHNGIVVINMVNDDRKNVSLIYLDKNSRWPKSVNREQELYRDLRSPLVLNGYAQILLPYTIDIRYKDAIKLNIAVFKYLDSNTFNTGFIFINLKTRQVIGSITSFHIKEIRIINESEIFVSVEEHAEDFTCLKSLYRVTLKSIEFIRKVEYSSRYNNIINN